MQASSILFITYSHWMPECTQLKQFPHYITNLISTIKFFFFKKYKYFSIIFHHMNFQFPTLSNTIFNQTTTWPPAWYCLWELTKRLSDINSMIFIKKKILKISITWLNNYWGVNNMQIHKHYITTSSSFFIQYRG